MAYKSFLDHGLLLIAFKERKFLTWIKFKKVLKKLNLLGFFKVVGE